MPPLMIRQTHLPREPSATLLAPKLPHPRVPHPMQLQVALTDKTRTALLADIIPDLRVYYHVTVQVVSRHEPLSTLWALK